MIVSTRGRYALRVMTDLAEHQDSENYIALKSIAERQNISQKYIESIMTMLSKAGFVDAVHGKGGGYRLNREPEKYSVRKILELTEGSLAPVSCLECNAAECARKDQCRTLPMWKDFYRTTLDFFEKYTLKDLMKK
ncbi:MAG: Rrf2 family transcriptional regulator [Treponemataceae bacterium]|nr:Rrf2 family transcriptional regulator [Treponemataceae bacterium]